MVNNLLASQFFTGAYTFVLGMVVVFLGIAIIVLFVSLTGNVFSKVDKQKVKEEKNKNIEPKIIQDANVQDIEEEVKVAIIAAISAYYFNKSNSKCDFVVRKIKKL